MRNSLSTELPEFSNGRTADGPPTPEVSVIIPARDEECNIGDCLASLTAQGGVDFEIIVVDDASSDATRKIAESFSGVRVLSPGPVAINAMGRRWTGKNNAVIAGAHAARGDWLLFTDADTVHLPGSLARALDEAKTEESDLLSYSPQQVVETLAERAVMPVVFAELASAYPMAKVGDSSSGVVAANGQYILMRRDAYEAIGGHAAVGAEILEDVALARGFREAGYRIKFRYGADAVRTRMYRTWAQLREGWIKNLALLFPRAGVLALQTLSLWIAAWLSVGFASAGVYLRHPGWMAFALTWVWQYRRVGRANFSAANHLIAVVFGPPAFAYLLLRSRRAHAEGRVSWKRRAYDVSAPRGGEIPRAHSQAAVFRG